MAETRLTAEGNGVERSLRSLAEASSVPSSNPIAGNSRDLDYYLSLILKRKWLILSIVTLVTTLTALHAFSLPSIYEATATLRLEPKEQTFMEDRRSVVFHGYDNYEYSNTQIRLLSNPQLMRKVILQLNLENDSGFLESRKGGSLLSQIRGAFSPAKAKPVSNPAASVVGEEPPELERQTPQQIARMEPYVNALLANLKVEPIENTSLVNVRFTHTNPATAFSVLDTLSKVFVESSNKYETASSEAADEKLARQTAEVQLTLKNLEQQRIDYLKSHNLPLGQGQGRNLTAERLGTLSSQLLAAENDRKNLEAVYESAKSAKDIWSIPQVRDSKDLQEMRKNIRDLEQKRAALMELYTPKWPQVKQIDSELKQLNDNIKASANEALDSLKSNLDAAAARESKLREAYYREQTDANYQSQDEIELASLNQQIDTSKQIYNTLFARQKEIEVNAIGNSNRVSVATPPALPLEPIGPPRFRQIFLAFFVSMFAGIGLALLVHQLDTRLKSPEDVANHVYLPTLALIPAFKGSRGSQGVNGLISIDAVGNKATALTRNRRSPTAEAYRHLRTSLLFNRGVAPKSILVTSGRPLEGKTTTAVCMAISLAQAGAEVLLIDGDLRKPRIHSYFGLSNEYGFTDCIDGHADLENLVHAYAEYPNLRVITAGRLPSNPADLLGSDETRRLVEVLKERFEYVIVDSPPASAFADAAILSTLVDGVVLVVHRRRHSRRVVRHVKDRLLAVGARIYGVVLNHANAEAEEYYSGYYSNYYPDDNGN